MKKIALLGFCVAWLVGCANTPTHAPKLVQKLPKTNTPNHVPSIERVQPATTQATQYRCEQGVHIQADQDIEPKTQKKLANLTVHAPILGLHNQSVQLLHIASDPDEHYINDKNPDSIYHWHTNGTQGYFVVTASSKQYGYRCQTF